MGTLQPMWAEGNGQSRLYNSVTMVWSAAGTLLLSPIDLKAWKYYDKSSVKEFELAQ